VFTPYGLNAYPDATVHHSGEFMNFKIGELTDGNISLWLLVDWSLYREEQDSGQGLGLFGSIVYNTDD
jgi:hypothetical protein